MRTLSQRDDRWKNIKLGTSNVTIGSHGCTITCIAMLADTTPDVVNSRLLSVNGYAEKNLVIWDKIKEALPDMYCQKIGWTYDNSDVSKNLPCLVEVDGTPIGAPRHWVVYIGNQKLLDPWTGKEEPTSKYKPISYRIIKGEFKKEDDTDFLKTDIPTEVEDKYGLKDIKRYNKHWTYDDLFKDWVKLVGEYEKLQESSKKEALELTEKASKLNEQCKSLLEKEKSLELIVEGLKATTDSQSKKLEELGEYERKYKELSLDFDELKKRNRELVEQLSVMSEHAKNAIAEKDIALARLEFLQISYDELSLDYENKEAELELANKKLKEGLRGYNKLQLLRALLGVY